MTRRCFNCQDACPVRVSNDTNCKDGKIQVVWNGNYVPAHMLSQMYWFGWDIKMIVLIVTCMVLCFGFVLKRALISKDILFGAEQCLQSQSLLCFSLCSASKWLRKRSWEGKKPCQLTQWHLGNNIGEKAKWCTGTEKWLESGGGTSTLKSIRRNQAERRRRRWSRCKSQDSPGAPCRKPCWGSYFPAACGENYTGTDVYYAACGKDQKQVEMPQRNCLGPHPGAVYSWRS